MKSMFDNYFGGRVSSRAMMMEKIRQMKTNGSVIEATIKAVEARTPAEQVSDRVKYAKENKWQIVTNRKSGAPFVGDAIDLI